MVFLFPSGNPAAVRLNLQAEGQHESNAGRGIGNPNLHENLQLRLHHEQESSSFTAEIRYQLNRFS
jgi:hypothetical protein